MLKIFSTTNPPVRTLAIMGPMYVITGIREFLRACLKVVMNSLIPLALAVRM